MRMLRPMLLTAALQQVLKGATSKFIHPLRFQRDNAERSLFAGETARLIGGDPETARTAGLLQDLLLPMLTDAYTEVYRKFDPKQTGLAEFERDHFGWDHAALLAKLSLRPALLAAPLAFVTALPLAAQDDGAPRQLDGESRNGVIEAIAAELERAYVFPDVAARMSADLRARLRAGEYDPITERADFAARLTADLQAISNDRHLRVRAGPGQGAFAPASARPSADQALLNARISVLVSAGENGRSNRAAVCSISGI